MINGVRATDVFHEPVTVTLEYPLKGKQVPEKVSVFHIDGKELEAIGFDYIEGEGVRFDAAHFSLYLIGYEGHLSGDRDWIFEISVAMVFLLSMYILIAALRRDDDDEEEHK